MENNKIDVIDNSLKLAFLFFITSAIGWFSLTFLFDLFVNFKLLNINLLNPFPVFSYGKLSAALNSSLIFGWVSNCIFFISLWVMSRLSNSLVQSNILLILFGVVWNISLSLGIIGIFNGDIIPYKYFELPEYVSYSMSFSLIIILVWGVMSFRHKTSNYSYVSQWYTMGALLWFPWVYITSQFFLNWFPLRGVLQNIIHSWYYNNILYLWIVPSGLALIYYLIPKLTNRNIKYYHLAAVGFWTYSIFVSWAAFVDLEGSPVPVWIVSVSKIAAIELILPTTILICTLSFAFNKDLLSSMKSLKFLRLSIFFLILNLLLKVLMSFKIFASYFDLTQFSTAMDVILIYGFFNSIIFALLYYLFPRMCNFKFLMPENYHYYLHLIGVLLLVLTYFTISAYQGYYFNKTPLNYIDISAKVDFFYKLKLLASLILLLSYLIFLANLTWSYSISLLRSRTPYLSTPS